MSTLLLTESLRVTERVRGCRSITVPSRVSDSRTKVSDGRRMKSLYSDHHRPNLPVELTE